MAKPPRVCIMLHETAKWVSMESSCYETQHVETAKDAQDFGRMADYNTPTFGFGRRTAQGPPLLRILNCQSPQNLKSVPNCFVSYWKPHLRVWGNLQRIFKSQWVILRLGAKTVWFLWETHHADLRFRWGFFQIAKKVLRLLWKTACGCLRTPWKPEAKTSQLSWQPNWDRLPPPCGLHDVHKNITKLI